MLDFKFPDIGEGIQEGEIVKWHVKEGDQVQQDQVLVEVETDKAIVQIPSPRAGTIGKILYKEGDTIKVGETLVTILDAGEKPENAPVVSPAPPENRYTSSVVGQIEESAEVIEEKHESLIESTPAGHPAHVNAMPAVKRLARDLHIDLSKIQGTGHGGRITEDDVRKVAADKGRESVQEAVKVSRKYDFFGYVERIPLRGVRKTIADRMTKSFSTAVHVSHMDEADATDLVALREKEKAKVRDFKLTYIPFIVKATIAALKEHPILNATLDDENQEIVVKKYFNIGIAVDTEDGLIVPVVKNAQNKTILEIAREVQDLGEKARARKLDLMDMKGGTFTITNIGSLGGLYATPIINWPECAILAVGRIYEKPVAKDGKVMIRSILPFTITFDHRVLDGAECARFANTFKQHIEDPEWMLIEGK